MAMLLSILRHVLTTAGGGMVASGHLSDADLQAAVGAILVLVGVVSGVLQKRSTAAKES